MLGCCCSLAGLRDCVNCPRCLEEYKHDTWLKQDKRLYPTEKESRKVKEFEKRLVQQQGKLVIRSASGTGDNHT